MTWKRFLVILGTLAVLAAPATAQASFPWSDRPAAPTSSQNCTPLAAPVVCLEINGSGLHVNYFRVQAIFSHEVEVGSTVKGYWRVKNGTGSNVVLQSKFVTYTVQGGTWYSWKFTVNTTYANPWTACGQFLDTVPGGQFGTYQPCGSIHSLNGPGRPQEAPGSPVFDVLDFQTNPNDAGLVTFEATIENLSEDTWRLALAFDVSDAAVAHFGPTVQPGYLTPHEVTTVQFQYRPPGPGHYSVVLGAWGKSATASWSEWAGASAGFTIA